MANRHLARTIALQTLFEWDFHHRSRKIFEIFQRNFDSFAHEFDDKGFTESLIKGVTKNLPAIDQAIGRFAPEWPLEQITVMDRNILRLGIYELMFNPEIPARVAINEAIELAKAFGGEASYKFVNGVLGSIYKTLDKSLSEKPLRREISDFAASPEATTRAYQGTDTPRRSGASAAQRLELQPLGTFQAGSKATGDGISLTDEAKKLEPQEISVGAVVFRRGPGLAYFALIKDAIDRWTFPKGKIGDKIKGEDELEALKRELEEELGISHITILDRLGHVDVTVHPPGKPAYPKRIFYYLVETAEQELNPEQSEGVKDAGWFSAEEALKSLGYENTKRIFQLALSFITNKYLEPR